MNTETRLLTTPEVLALTGYKSRTTLWRRVKAGKFPPPVALSEHAVRWNSTHIHDYIAGLPTQRYGSIIEGERS
ncbi:MAG: AlpA family phage regulatory protein [Pseudomonadota bacterium]